MNQTAEVPRADILMLIPNLGMGGAQRVFRDHSQLLGERYRVVDVAFNLDGGVLFPSGNPLLTLDVGGGGGAIAKVRNLQRRVAALRRIKRESGARLCISHMPGADYVNLLSKGSERTICVVHGSKRGDRAVSGLSGFVQKRLLQPWLYRRADRIVTVSRDIADEMAQAGVEPRRLQTINNFFDHDAIRKAAAVPLTSLEQSLFDLPVISSSGRLHPQKDQLGLLDVFAELRRTRPARLILLGDGELRDKLLSRADALGLSTWAAWKESELRPGHDLYLLGSRENPFQWLARSDLFAFPSAWEGFPLALCEAMICGVPVVSTDCPTGPREILAPDSRPDVAGIQRAEAAPFGMLMPLISGNPHKGEAVKTWAGTLSSLLDDAATRRTLGERGRARMEDFTRARIGDQWFALIASLLGNESSRS